MDEIYKLRKHIYTFITEEMLHLSNKKVIEFGPATPSTFPVSNLYINIKEKLIENSCNYLSCDINPDLNPDIVSDLVNSLDLIDETFDVIIALEVLEHTAEFWKAPKIFNTLLNPKGLLFISTPYFFTIHDPKPDYWRFTKEGLEYLFSPYFDLEISTMNSDGYDSNHPLHYCLKGEKK